MIRTLVIASNGVDRGSLSLLLDECGHAIHEATWNEWESAARGVETFSLVIAVADESELRSREFFDALGARRLSCPCLAVLPCDASAQLLAAVRSADDFILVPVRGEELRSRALRLVSSMDTGPADIKQRIGQEMLLRQFITCDRQLLRILDEICRLARTNAPVLIIGETGTGKELCARALHHLGPRCDRPFIPVDCPAIPDHLLENELFGHVRGAYTDAHGDQKGLVALARGGTLFLDEIDSLSSVSQAKLLRFLQDRMYRPLGSDRFVASDVVPVAAANRDLRECIEAQRFRGDLYYRLNVLNVTLPPLRARPDDIELLARHYARQFAPAGATPMLGAGVVELLRSYSWPGNVRELINTMQRAAALAETGRILPAHISFGSMPAPPPAVAPEPEVRFREGRAKVIETFERRYVTELLERHHGNVTRAARAAGKERRTFGRMIRKYNIDRHLTD